MKVALRRKDVQGSLTKAGTRPSAMTTPRHESAGGNIRANRRCSSIWLTLIFDESRIPAGDQDSNAVLEFSDPLPSTIVCAWKQETSTRH
jgi:hypothetical protein